MPESHPAESHDHKSDSAEKNAERSNKLSKDTPEATVSAHRAALRANPNRQITVSPDGKAQSFGITDNGKLIASKHNTDNAFFREKPHPQAGEQRLHHGQEKADSPLQGKTNPQFHDKVSAALGKLSASELQHPKVDLPHKAPESNHSHQTARESVNSNLAPHDQPHSGRTAGVGSLRDVADMAHGFADGFSQAVVETAHQSVDYLGKHNLVNDLAKGTSDSVSTAFNYYAEHLKTGDGKGVVHDAQAVGGTLWQGLKQWSDDYRHASHYERGKQAGKLSLVFVGAGAGEGKVAGEAFVNTTKNISKMLSTSEHFENVCNSISSTGRMLKSAMSAEKADQVVNDLGQTQAVFRRAVPENVFSKGFHGENPMEVTPENLKHFEPKGEGKAWKEARHDPKAVEAIDKMFKPGAEGVSAKHVEAVKETLLSLPAQHMRDLQSKGFTIHAPRCVQDVIPDPKISPEHIAGITNFDIPKNPRIVVPERIFAESSETLRELGVNTEGVTRHEVGHGLDYIHGWSEKDAVFDSHIETQRSLRHDFVKYNTRLEKQLNAAVESADHEQFNVVRDLMRKADNYGQYLTFEGNCNVGVREVVADFYAIAHGGTNRLPGVAEKLFDDFSDINDYLVNHKWPRKWFF